MERTEKLTTLPTCLPLNVECHSPTNTRLNSFLSHRVNFIRYPNCVKTLSSLRFSHAYRAFSHDVTAAMLVYLNKGTAVILVYQANPLGIELYFYVNTFFCFIKPIWPLVT